MVYNSLTQFPSFGLCPLTNFLETLGFIRWWGFQNVMLFKNVWGVRYTLGARYLLKNTVIR
jgi:hypothetical protein